MLNRFLIALRISLMLMATANAATAVAQQSAQLSWTAPTTRTDATPITGTVQYNIYQGLPGFSLMPLAPPVITNLTGTLWPFQLALTTPQTVCWAVTAIETVSPAAGVESAPSNEGCKVFVAVPNVVGLTQALATTSITGGSLLLGGVTTAISATVPVGLVISQTPAAGAIVAATTQLTASNVSIVISSGTTLQARPNPPTAVVTR